MIGVAAQNSPECQITAPCRTEFRDGIPRVIRATRHKTAVRTQQGSKYVLIDPDHHKQHGFHCGEWTEAMVASNRVASAAMRGNSMRGAPFFRRTIRSYRAIDGRASLSLARSIRRTEL